MDDQNQTQGLSIEAFTFVFNLYLVHTFIGKHISELDWPVDDQENLLASFIGAICIMLRSVPGTEYWDSRNAADYRKMLEFLDPYLVTPYRPASNELPVALYVPDRGKIYL